MKDLSSSRVIFSLSKKHSWFTLVELIIVITILSILGLVAFIMMNDATVSARDSNRLASIKNIYDASQLQAVQQRMLPLPDQAIALTVSGIDIGWQGYMSWYVAQAYGYSDSVYDPQDHTPYIYRVGQARDKSQYLAYLENGSSSISRGDILLADFSTFLWINTAQATDFSKRVPYVYGDKLGIILSSTTNEPANALIYNTNTNTGTLDLGSSGIDTNYFLYVNESLKLSAIEGTGTTALKTNNGLDTLLAGATIVASSWSSSGSGSGSGGGSNDPTCGLTSQEVIDLNAVKWESYTAEDWCAMTNLQWNNLGLTDIPNAVAKLRDVEILDLGNNSFTVVPLEIQSLTGLQKLYLSYNQISIIPEFIGNLSNLTELSFWHNLDINTVPDSLENLTHLTYLDFDENVLLGDLGTWWATTDTDYWTSFEQKSQSNITPNGQTVSISSSLLFPYIQIQIDPPPPPPPVIHFSPIVTEKRIAAWVDHTCGISSTGWIICWGYNWYGAKNFPPWITNATHIDVGWWNGCVRTSDGNVSCWWSDGYDNEYNNWDEIEEIPTGYFSNESGIDINWQHVCALNSNGSIKCYGQDVPAEITSRTDFVQVTTWAEHSCALDNRGWVVCWWSENEAPWFAFDFISAGWYDTCGIRHDDQSVMCWWRKANWNQWVAPWTIPNTTGITKVTVGDSHACAITWWNVICWGDNWYGQTNVPVWLSNVVDIDAWEYHTCALKNDNSVACWGDRTNGYNTLHIEPPLTWLN